MSPFAINTIAQIKNICREYDIVPSRQRGQNFLINEVIVKEVIQTAELNKDDIVLEIGSGFGILTEEIAVIAKKVLAIEIDKTLANILKKRFVDFKNTEIIQDDIRCFDSDKYGLKKYKLIANLPFNLSGFILRKFLTAKNKPELISLVLQKEIGRKIIAQPGEMTKLSLMVQLYGQVKIVKEIKSGNFWPRPKVDSIIIKIKPFKRINFDQEKLFQFIRAGFSSPRKYLLNNLIKSGIIEKEKAIKKFQKLGMDLKIRAEDLSVENWKDLGEEEH
jgi:16S rRNA (adenine1518-N6/adenine1519-N6)-dimethyltransferase